MAELAKVQERNRTSRPGDAATVGVGKDCFLTYHELSATPPAYLYAISKKRFEEHLKFVAGVAKERAQEAPRIAVTFDDGHVSTFHYAFPLLQAAGIRATFFILPGKIGQDRQFLSWEQVRQLHAAGHRVESHGWSHRLLTHCSDRDLQDEVSRSKRELEDRLGTAVMASSAPGGRWGRRVVEACARAGYREFFHSDPWRKPTMQDDVFVRGRLMITSHMGPRDISKYLFAGRFERLIRRSRRMGKEGLRSLMGDRVYHRLWCLWAGSDSGSAVELHVESPTAAQHPAGER